MRITQTGTEDAGGDSSDIARPSDAAGAPDAPSGRRRNPWTGALPLGVLLVVAVAVALLVSPWLREQARTSFTRQPDPYLALFFDDEQQARQCPLDSTGQLVLQVGLTSQLRSERVLTWKAQITPTNGTAASATSEGTVPTTPGRTSDFTVRLDAPRGDFTFTLTLPGRSERLQLHCGAT